jgi:hypothetical protein
MTALDSITPSIPPRGISAQEDKQGHCAAAIQEIFQKIADLLLLIWFAIQYVGYRLMTAAPFTRGQVFQGKVICMTSNHAKFSDLPSYVALRRHPSPLSPDALKIVSDLGLEIETTHVTPKPFCEGHCLGNTMVFLKKWLESPDIEQVAKAFEGGSPLEGAIYQEGYEKLLEVLFPSEEACMRASFANADLAVERFYQIDSSEDVLRSLSVLNPGAYKLTLPQYSPTGDLEGHHSLGLIIDTQKCYILDSNDAIGWTMRKDLRQTMGRIFTEYTGFDYSQDLQGTYPSFRTKVGNFLKEQANPPAAPLKPRFELLKIGKSTRIREGNLWHRLNTRRAAQRLSP